jgi:hypothetical protein
MLLLKQLKRGLKTSLKMFKHYKLKPSFPIIKDNKKKDRAGQGRAGGGGFPPPPNFGRSINPNLIQFFFFHPTGYLKINQN